MKYIDIHSHLNLKPLKAEQEQIISRMRVESVASITVGVDFKTSQEAVELAARNSDILWATVGLHPTDNLQEDFDYEAYLSLAQHEKVVAIGECGLDYFRHDCHETKQKQKELFLKHITLAQATNKSLMIHARPSKGSMDAYEDVLDILEHLDNKPKMNFHFFVGNISIAERILRLGGTMSFDGPITFTEEYDDVIRYIPIESIHAETDAPFAAPVPYRGQTNYPYYVSNIVNRIARIKDMDQDTVRRQLLENVKRIFAIY